MSRNMMVEFAALAGIPLNEDVAVLEQAGGSKDAIGTLRDTDYRDQDAFFKMVQLLKWLAAAADEDELARKYLSRVSDALTDAAKDVLGKEEACATPGEKKRSKGKGRGLARGDGEGPMGVPAGDEGEDEVTEDLVRDAKAVFIPLHMASQELSKAEKKSKKLPEGIGSAVRGEIATMQQGLDLLMADLSSIDESVRGS